MAAPTKTIVNETYEGEDIRCAKFSCSESSDFKIVNVAPINDDYQFQIVAKSTTTKMIYVTLGGVTKSISITSEFKRYTLPFMTTVVTSSNDLILSFPSGDFWLYNIQLERASSPSGWRPAPEDSADEAAVTAATVAEAKAAAAIEAQTQADIFNKLTNGGMVQGLYLSAGKIYLNATYIQTGTLSIKKNNVETFYANADTGVVRIKADEFSLSDGSTLAGTLQTAENYADSAASTAATNAVNSQTQLSIFNKLTNNGQTQGIYLSSSKIYINASYIKSGAFSVSKSGTETFYADSSTGTVRIKADSFSLSDGTTLASTLQSAKTYADSAASGAVDAQTQLSIFNKLTNNGQTQGIYLSSSKIYINASYISAGTLSADRIGSKTITAAKLADAVNSSISSAQTAANSANDQTQLIYISKASGTTSVSAPSSWVTSATGSQNTWTLKRPQYSSSYPVCFVATQRKTVGGTITCTTPQMDLTTTVIDGGRITTGTIDASVVSVVKLNASNITSGTMSAARISGGTLTDTKGNMTWNLSTGAMTAKNLSISSTNFTLTSAGVITAKSGTIGGFTIDATSIRSAGLTSTASGAVGLSTVDFSRSISGSTRSGLRLAVGSKFGVSNTGVLYAADAILSGTIASTSGSVGGWNITSYGLYKSSNGVWTSYIGDSGYIRRSIAGSGSRSDWIAVFGDNFGVNVNGAFYCSSGYINNVLIEADCDPTPVAGKVITAAQAQIESIIANTVTANYITAKVAVLGALSARSDGIGVSGTVYASGNISASTVYASSGYQTLGANGVSATVSLKDPNGNTAASLVFTNGIITSAGGTYQFNCTKTFYYTKTQKTIYAYASSTSASRIAYSFDYVSYISASSGGTAVTI